MAKENTPATGMVGVPGLSTWRGHIYEEYLNDLKGVANRSRIFRQMLDDAVIGALMDALWMPLLGAEFSVPALGESDIEERAASFVYECMNDMNRYSWRQHVLDMLSITAWGWAVIEYVFKKRMGPNGNPGSKYDDGLIGMRILDPRGQETLYRWEFDEYYDVKEMIQQDPVNGAFLHIPAWKMLHATYRSRKRNPEGQAPLRSLYRAWYTRKSLEIVEAIGAERDLAGLPVIYLPQGASTEDKEKAVELVRKVRLDEESGLVIPRPPQGVDPGLGWKFELVGSTGSKMYDVREIIRDLNKIILMRFFAQFLLLGMEQVGTQALVEGSQDFFAMALKSVQEELMECWNDQMVPTLFRLNAGTFSNLKEYPKIEWAPPASRDMKVLAEVTKMLRDAGIILPDDDLEAYFRASLKLPDMPEPETDEEGNPVSQPREQEPVSVVPPEGEELLSYEHKYLGDGSWLIRPKAHRNPPRRHAKPYRPVAVPTDSHEDYAIGPMKTMVAVTLPRQLARQVHVTDGEPARSLHCTLTFHGETTDAEYKKIVSVTKSVSQRQAPFWISLVGADIFSNNEGQRVFHAHVDSDPLLEFRHALATAFEEAGVYYSQDYVEYKPHVTLKYLEDGEIAPNHDIHVSFPVAAVWAYRGGHNEIIPFGDGSHIEYADVAGTTGRREDSRAARSANDYQEELVLAFDQWSRGAVTAISAADKAGKTGKALAAVIGKETLKLSEKMKALGRRGLKEAVAMGMKDAEPDPETLRTVADLVESNEKYIDESLIPRLHRKIAERVAEEKVPAQASEQLYDIDRGALTAIFQGLRYEPAQYAGAFYNAVFVGAGLLQGRENKERKAEGKKPRRVRWELDPGSEHCHNSAHGHGCAEIAGIYDSWDAMPTVPAGQVTCLGNCNCNISVENEDGSWTRVT